MLQLIVPLAIVTAFYIALVEFLKYKYKKADSFLYVWFHKRIAMPIKWDRIACGSVSLMLVSASGVLLLLVVSLASQDPTWASNIENHSLFMHAFIPEPEPEVLAVTADGVPIVIEKPTGIFSSIKRGLSSVRNAVSDATGISALTKEVSALREILNLSPVENAWLVEHNPKLKKLLYHPSLLAIMENNHVLKLIDQVGRGSPSALIELGDNPDLKNLLEDKTVLDAVHSLDLFEMRNQIKTQRQNTGKRYPMHWWLSEIRSTLSLDAQLKKTTEWRNTPTGNTLLDWPDNTKIGLARSGLELQDPKPVRLNFQFHAEGQITLLINDTPIPLKEEDGMFVATVTMNPGKNAILVMIEFSGQTPKRSCLMEAFIPK
jgi:hypothetical protein